jgi:hypothetical protein
MRDCRRKKIRPKLSAHRKKPHNLNNLRKLNTNEPSKDLIIDQVIMIYILKF